MRNIVIIETAAMITRRRAKDNRNTNTIRVFSLSALLIAAASLLLATSANGGSSLPTSLNADGTIALGSLVYNMNAGGTTNTVVTTATGSGKYDAVVYVPVSLFNLSDKYVYLYFAGQGNGGFEEWTAATLTAPIPEASALFPIVGLLAAIFSTHFLRRRQMARISK